jgi:deoxyribonuclease-1
MKLKSAHLLFFMSLLVIFVFFFLEFFNPPQKRTREYEVESEEISYSGNVRVENFEEAKKLLRKFYAQNTFETFYCGCAFTGSHVQLDSCPFKPSSPKSKRAKRIEWEHVVPASQFGQYFPSWKKGHKNCRNAYGKDFKGRRCAQLISKKYRLIEADLYNLVPAIGEVNAMRSNYPVSILGEGKNLLKGCDTKIFENKIEPRVEVRGLMARIYLYMDRTYPGYQIIHSENKNFLESWSKEYPPNEHEIKRNQYIENVQGNSFIELSIR